MHGDKMVTKHDSRIAGRKNACKVMDLPPTVCTGDGGSFDMEVNNGVSRQCIVTKLFFVFVLWSSCAISNHLDLTPSSRLGFFIYL